MPSENSKASIVRSWAFIEDWLNVNTDGRLTLPDGVTDEELSEAEETLGIKLPRLIRESYKCHDGSGSVVLFPFLNELFPLLCLPDTVGYWRSIQKALARGSYDTDDFVASPNGPIRKVWLHPKWIPLVHDQSGDFYFADLAPAKGGKRGQVITFSRTDGPNEVASDNIAQMLSNACVKLQEGHFVYDKKSNLIRVRPN